MDKIFSASRAVQLRQAFGTYNISRMQGLIRFLSPKKFELFQNLPFWVHVNVPGVPGYVDSLHTPYGIYQFENSGFHEAAVRRLNAKEKALVKRLPRKEYVLGMYLMGSSGTLAQTEKSDFDYWAIVDTDSVDSTARNLFQEKLRRIEEWSRERYDQEVRIFELHMADVRANEFSSVDEDSSGSAQKSLLKEEFYRTFIMIAGKIPFWVVMPPGLSDVEYDEWIEQAAGSASHKFSHEDYIDLGNLKTINPGECLGAILWQLFKARKYPAKSLLKAGLVAHYFFSMQKEGLLCDRIKERFSKSSASGPPLDPYAVMFQTVIDFFDAITDDQGALLLKECIFLRLSQGGRSVQPDSPRQKLLKKYLHEWAWGEEKIRKMAAYLNWPEKEKLAFENKIFNKITFLYQLIFQAHSVASPDVSMKSSDLLLLKNHLSAAIKNKPGKLPRCSAYMRSLAAGLMLQVCGYRDETGLERWNIYHLSGKALDPLHIVFEGPELLKCMGWLLANGVSLTGGGRIQFQAFDLKSSIRRLEDLFRDVSRFLSGRETDSKNMEVNPEWKGMVIYPRAIPDAGIKRLSGVELLIVNSWGEYFFESVDLAATDGISFQCELISDAVLKYSEGAPDGIIPYLIIRHGKNIDLTLSSMIESAVTRTHRPLFMDASGGQGLPPPDIEDEDELFLDL